MPMAHPAWLCFCIAMLFAATGGAVVMEPEAPGPGSATTHWKVRVDGEPVPVFSTVVFHGGPAYFCAFETDGPAEIEAQPAWAVRDAVVRPLSKGTTPDMAHHVIRFSIDGPGAYSVEPNGLVQHPLFVFASPSEVNPPDPDDPNVLYFGPGVHRLDHPVRIESGQEVYIAAGAWIKAVMPDDEKPFMTGGHGGMPRYDPLFHATDADNITIRGTGIIDMTSLDWLARECMRFVRCKNLHIGGVTVLDCPAWTVIVAQSDDAVIDGVKMIGHRESNDGIDLLNSRGVTVRNCFARVGDDGIVVKTFPEAGPARNILVEDCVIWNDKVRAIGITAETAEPISDVTFRNIDIIHDLASGFDMAWTMAIYMEDCGPISDICFDDIRCEDVREQFIQIAITKGQWATTEKLGPVERVVFRNISYLGENLPHSEIRGNDTVNAVRGVLVENLVMNGRVIDSPDAGNFTVNAFAEGVRFVPSP